MIFLTKEEELQFNGKIIALYFYASWMPFHKKMVTMINKIEDKYKDIRFVAIDVDYFKGLCKRFNVGSIPEVVVFSNGKELKRINGLVLTSAFKSIFADICYPCNLSDNGEV
jgi:thiol-disulfide isomerase/thioredoxin